MPSSSTLVVQTSVETPTDVFKQPIKQTDTTNLVPPAEPTTLVPSSVLHATSQHLYLKLVIHHLLDYQNR